MKILLEDISETGKNFQVNYPLEELDLDTSDLSHMKPLKRGF